MLLSFNKLYRSHDLFVVQLGHVLPELAGNTKLEGQLNLEVKRVIFSSSHKGRFPINSAGLYGSTKLAVEESQLF